MDETKPRVLRHLSAALARLTGRSAFDQKSTEVYVREPGRRFLEGPRPVAVEARKDWEFAWLSEAAYGRSLGEIRRVSTYASTPAAASGASPTPAQGATEFDTADAVLNDAGWTLWSDFPGIELSKKMMVSHLRVEIWEKKEPPSVAVAFGGTIFTSGKDWKSNLRWFLPFHEDEYTEVVNVFGPAFVAEFSKRAKDSGEPVCGTRQFFRPVTLLAADWPSNSPIRCQSMRLIPLSQVDQYLGLAGRIRNGAGFDFFARS